MKFSQNSLSSRKYFRFIDNLLSCIYFAWRGERVSIILLLFHSYNENNAQLFFIEINAKLRSQILMTLRTVNEKKKLTTSTILIPTYALNMKLQFYNWNIDRVLL